MEELDTLYNDLLLELECPVCTNYMTPPIRQCKTGHSICEPCRKKLPKCPLCQTDFTEAKNLSLEALASKMHYPCVNQSLGCDAKLMLEQREKHEKNCSVTGIRCAMSNCAWIGKVEDLSKHWASKTTKRKPYQSFAVCQTNIIFDSYYTNLVETYKQMFWFKCNLKRGKIYWAVQFIGDKDKAADYFYEIEIFKVGFSKRTILFSNYCQSVDIPNDDLFKEGNCTAMSIDCLLDFADKNQILNYHMHVHKDEVGDIDKEQH